jgi:hypothetical protein
MDTHMATGFGKAVNADKPRPVPLANRFGGEKGSNTMASTAGDMPVPGNQDGDRSCQASAGPSWAFLGRCVQRGVQGLQCRATRHQAWRHAR